MTGFYFRHLMQVGSGSHRASCPGSSGLFLLGLLLVFPPPCLCKCERFYEPPMRSAGGLVSFGSSRSYFEEKFASARWMFQATELAVCTQLAAVTAKLTNKKALGSLDTT